jgi:hypothetical protein
MGYRAKIQIHSLQPMPKRCHGKLHLNYHDEFKGQRVGSLHFEDMRIVVISKIFAGMLEAIGSRLEQTQPCHQQSFDDQPYGMNGG